MNATSGFREVQSSTSQSLSFRFLHEQRINSEKVSGTFSVFVPVTG